MNASEAYQAIRSSSACGRSGCDCRTGRNIHCPNSSGHKNGDRTPSCGLSLVDAGKKIVVTCPSCDAAYGKGFIMNLLIDRGLWYSEDENDKVIKFHDHVPKGGEKVARYEFRDIKGKLKAIKERYEMGAPDPVTGKRSKRFIWSLPDTTDPRSVSEVVPNKEMPLYGTETLAGIPKPSRIWLVEGEKARHACLENGIPYVLGFAFGSGQREFGNTLDVLKGHDIRFWPDNDDDGRKFAARMRVELRGIAKSYEIVSPPVPEKGDAVEYFAEGGTLDALDKTIEPDKLTVQRESVDDLTVIMPTQIGIVRFHFSEMLRSSKALDTLLEITFDRVGYPKIRNRTNLESLSARRDVITQLNHITGKEMKEDRQSLWEGIILEVWNAAREAYDEYDDSVLIGDIEMVTPPSWLIDGVVAEDAVSIIFGDGSATKTYLVMRAMQCLYFGLPFLPELVDWNDQQTARIKKQDAIPTRRKGVRTLYLDWENNKNVFRWRMDRVAQGLGLDPVDLINGPFRYKNANGTPLHDMAYMLRRLIQEQGIDLLVIDSAAMAAGGEAEKSDTANRFFQQGLRVLGEKLTTLIIAHVPKGGDTYKPFGSTFWHNNARYTCYIERLEGAKAISGDGMVDVMAFPRKVNEFAIPKQWGYSINFNDGLGDQESGAPVEFRPIGAAKSLVLPDANLTLPQLFLKIIKANPGITRKELREHAGFAENVSGSALSIEPRRTVARLVKENKVGEIDGALWPIEAIQERSTGSQSVPF